MNPKKHWTEVATGWAGTPYGHVPGHRYHDVDVTVETACGRYRVEVLETWGCSQGYDREEGRRRVVATGDDLAHALNHARDKGRLARQDYLEEALAAADAAALDALEARDWTQVATGWAGTPYGHVPGHRYHDVDVTVETACGRYRVEVLETWGCSQGYDREEGRRRVVAIDAQPDWALDAAVRKAKRIGCDAARLEQACDRARPDAAAPR